jgi:hypothetical protein
MSSVISLTLMAYTLDYNNAQSYVPRARCASVTTPPITREHRTVVDDCLVWLVGEDPASLAAGALFLK